MGDMLHQLRDGPGQIMERAAFEDAPYFADGQLIEERLPSLIGRGIGRLADGIQLNDRTRVCRSARKLWQIALPGAVVLIDQIFAAACRAVARLISGL